jgi:hypothetical protein
LLDPLTNSATLRFRHGGWFGICERKKEVRKKKKVVWIKRKISKATKSRLDLKNAETGLIQG